MVYMKLFLSLFENLRFFFYQNDSAHSCYEQGQNVLISPSFSCHVLLTLWSKNSCKWPFVIQRDNPIKMSAMSELCCLQDIAWHAILDSCFHSSKESIFTQSTETVISLLLCLTICVVWRSNCLLIVLSPLKKESMINKKLIVPTACKFQISFFPRIGPRVSMASFAFKLLAFRKQAKEGRMEDRSEG